MCYRSDLDDASPVEKDDAERVALHDDPSGPSLESRPGRGTTNHELQCVLELLQELKSCKGASLLVPIDGLRELLRRLADKLNAGGFH
jgi:hypothetical protein